MKGKGATKILHYLYKEVPKVQGGWQLKRWGRCELHPSPQVVRDVSPGLVNHSRWLTLHDRTDMIWYW
jgi:hypothetical protein